MCFVVAKQSTRLGIVWLGAVALGQLGCWSGGASVYALASTNGNDTGPRIVWDAEATPLPNLPLPNDIATRPDPTSPTGLRVNIPLAAPTAHETTLRRQLAELDGFSTYGPLSLSFDGPIDVLALKTLHADSDFANDGIYLINLNRSSPSYGKPVPLDIGGGRFPLGLERSDQYFGADPRAGASNMVFEMADEDTDGDGALSWQEDTDDDGVLDRPNVWGQLYPGMGQDPYKDLIDFYALESNTLLVRPALPLQQQSTYAVVVTRRVLGLNSGSPVRSPFSGINHVQQTPALLPLVQDGLLDRLGLDVADVAFAWSFTTQSISHDLEAVRAGLWGQGPFSYLGDEFAPSLTAVDQVDEPERTDNVYVLKPDRLLAAFEGTSLLELIGQSSNAKVPLIESYRRNVSHLVFAELDSPAFLANDEGIFQMDWQRGTAAYGRDRLYLLCVVPKPMPGRKQPFPVILYAHGTGSSRMELFGFAGFWAGFGFATCGIDAYAHGLFDSPAFRELADSALAPYGLERAAKVLFTGRATDHNGDGIADPGAGFWTANSLRTRDMVRQTVVDHLQLVRVLRSFGSGTMPVDVNGDGALELAGDFDGDGVADFGGEQDYYMTGGSLGGIMTAVVGAVEPSIRALAPTSGGAGLSDIAVRSVQRYALEAIWMPILGPLVVSTPTADAGRLKLSFDALDVFAEKVVPFAVVPDAGRGELDAVQVGDRMRIINKRNGEVDEVRVRADASGQPSLAMRLQIAADRGDPVAIELWRQGAEAPYRVIDTFELDADFQGVTYAAGSSLVTLQEGFGYRRGSAPLRQLLGLAQMAVDPADPANYTRYYHTPLSLPPDGAVPKNVLIVNTPGDMNVPINTGMALARTAGFYDPLSKDPRYDMSIDNLLVRTHALVGLEKLRPFADDPCYYAPGEVLFDLDEASQGNDAEEGPHLSEPVKNPACDGSPWQPASCSEACIPRPPLRLTVEKPWGTSGVRLPYILPTGIHGYDLPDPSLDFDYNLYEIRQIGWFFATSGDEIVDDVCLASYAAPCTFLPDRSSAEWELP